ncbi:MAG: hypothetical protein OXK72_03295 [Gammaproteobacteria bacterium]|nr:hypothetical protein [Gammaproteobacteria bacterium]MDE0411078.1 hypothetical protein [Gammaproteobacteria bacterium]
MLKTSLGDALIWMETAETLYLKGTEKLNEYRGVRTHYPHVNKLNVAAVCAGYAFELALKVLVEAGGETREFEHKASTAYQQLIPGDREDVDRIIAKHGWHNPDEFLAYLDEHFCHRDRKYWMVSRKGGKARGVFSMGGRKGMNALRKVHKELSALALKKINDSRLIYEEWLGIEQCI